MAKYCLVGEDSLIIQCAEIIINRGSELSCIVSSKRHIKQWALEHAVDCYDSIEVLPKISEESKFDYLFSVANSYILSKSIINLPSRFAINYHHSPLPKYAGLHATSWAILNGEKMYGISWHLITDVIDGGHIIKQAKFPIDKVETALSLNLKCYEYAIRTFEELVDELEDDKFTLTEQDFAQRTYFTLNQKPPHNGVISWDMSAQEIHRLFRGLGLGHNYVNRFGLAKFIIENEVFIIQGLKVLPNRSSTVSGTILAISKKELCIKTATLAIAIYDIFLVDGTPCPIEKLVQNYNLHEGDRLQNPDQNFIDQFIRASSDFGKYEAYWLKALTHIQPGIPPLSLNTKLVQQANKEATVFFSKVDYALSKQWASILLDEEYDKSLVLLTVILLYLYRLNNYQHYTIKYSNPWLHEQHQHFKKFFELQIPFSVNFDPNMSFMDVLKNISCTVIDLKKHKTYARDMVLRYPELDLKLDSKTDCLFSINIEEDLNKFQPSEVDALSLVINEAGTEFKLFSRIDAAASPSIGTLVSNFSSHVITLMESITANPNICITKHSILSKAEYQKIFFEWNNTKTEFPNGDKPIQYFFEEQVLQRPNDVAVIFENKSLTYFELNKKANQVAQYLKNLGVLPDTIVALCSKRSLEMVIGMLGILKAGAAYLPLDPSYPADRLSYMITDSKSPIILTHTIDLNLKITPNVKVIEIGDILSRVKNEENFTNNCWVGSEHLAYVIYTSGTTGSPKGVAITHRSLVNHMLWMIPKFHFTNKDVFLQKTSFSFDASIWEFFTPLLCGAKLIIASNDEHPNIIQHIQKNKVTVLQLVPSILRRFLEETEFQACDSLQQIFAGGETLPADTVHLFHKKMQAKLHNLYGPTETTIQVTSYSYDSTNEQTEVSLIGKPISNAQIYVLDQYLNLLPVGVPGELFIGGLSLARGYLNSPDLTADRFIQNAYDTTPGFDKLYKTGDRGRWLPEGNVEYLGRLDGQIKFNGYRIEIGEIEATLLQHQGIKECAIVYQENTNNKNQANTNKFLTAYYVKESNVTHGNTDVVVKTWKTLYQEQYSLLDKNDNEQNIEGWNSSYTGAPIGSDAMREWIHATTDRIKQLNPTVILEIGSGSGLMLFNMLETCHYYYATDFSNNSVNYLNSKIKKLGYTNKASTLVCAADELPYYQLEKTYDTAIINSVVQYFPSLKYLENVITNTISYIQDKGKIFIGDIRDYRLLKCFHYSVQSYKQQTVSKVKIDYFASVDKELLVSPEYFIYLQSISANIDAIELLPKLGKESHEMNNYRYDVILHIRKNKTFNKECNENVTINDSNFIKVLDINNYVLSKLDDDYICIKYPNKRIAHDYLSCNKLYNNAINEDIIDRDNFLSMEEIVEYAHAINYEVKFFLDAWDPFYLNLILVKNSIFSSKKFFISYPAMTLKCRDMLSSNPLDTIKLMESQFTNELKEYLNAKLPYYMVPSRYVVLEKLPLNANGKLDRTALVGSEYQRSESYTAPQTDLENQLCQIWAEVLGLSEDKIGIKDDFFNLGGHSLSVLKVLSLIKSSFLIILSTKTFFDHPTIEKLASFIQKAQENPMINVQNFSLLSNVITLQENGFKAPLFLTHPLGGTVFWYKALSRYLIDRPIYAIQDPSINTSELLFKNIQEMASFYLKIIKKIQPSGPYFLAGASFGATVTIEITNQLLQAGEVVKFIGLLDGWPVYSKKFWEKDFFSRLLPQPLQQWDPQQSNQDLNDIHLPIKHRQLMLRNYKIPFIKSKLTFFKAEEPWPVFKEMVLPLDCWQPFSNQPVDTYLVPGNHETMFWEPHVQVLAKKMNKAISMADSEFKYEMQHSDSSLEVFSKHKSAIPPKVGRKKSLNYCNT